MKTNAVVLTILLVLVAGLSGCAKTGFSLEQKNSTGVEQPYRAVATNGINFSEVETLQAILFPLDAESDEWVGELGVMVKEKDSVAILRRETWRGYWKLDGNINDVPYPVVIDRIAKYLFFLVPNVKREDLAGAQAAVLSGASTRTMMPNGKIINLPRGEKDDTKLVEDFFKTHPATVENWQVIDLSPGTKAGDTFIADIKKRFPILLKIGNENLMATKDVVVASEMTTQDSMVDRVISHGKVPASLMSVLSLINPYSATIQSTQIFYGLIMVATDEEMYGPYGETKYPGWAVAKILGHYLRQNHLLIQHQEKQLRR